MRWLIRFLAFAGLSVFLIGLAVHQRGGLAALRQQLAPPNATPADGTFSTPPIVPATLDSNVDREITEPVSLAEFLRADQTGEAARSLGYESGEVPLADMSASSDREAVDEKVYRQASVDESGIAGADADAEAPARRAGATDAEAPARRAGATRVSSRGPHLLLVVVEDLSREDLGAYGQSLVRTPFLDQLAAKGVRLTQFAGSTSGHALERTALWYGDISNAKRDNVDKIVRLARPSLPESLTRAGYTTLLAGDCSWTRTGETRPTKASGSESRAGEWHDWCGWAELPEEKSPLDPRSLQHSADALDIPANRDAAAARFDGALLTGVARMIEQLEDRAPVAVVVPVSLRWWEDSMELDPQYDAEDWTERERRHASAVTALDSFVWELHELVDAARGKRGVAVVVVGLPRAKKTKGLRRFRDSVPALNDALPSTAAWPYAPVIAAWPGKIPEGRVVDGFSGFQDLLPTLLEMTGTPQRQRDGLGVSRWRTWTGAARE